jgi:RNA polymerase sigma-70 factor (ECF subfamily)
MWRALTAYSGSREVAEDAVAEAFAQALARGRELWAPERWVWKTAYRIAAGELQRRATNSVMAVDDQVPPDEPAWEVRAALAQLSPLQRAAVVLHYHAGYPARDVARIVGSTPAAVWVHLSRGRRRLRQILEESDE